MKKLYIDVDGVLLGKHNPDNIEVFLANHAKEFLELCLNNYDCYWLTTHCKYGTNIDVVRWLRKYSDSAVMELIKAIKPTSWGTSKTDAIDFSSDFLWIDDEPVWNEIETLKKNNAAHRWIELNTYKKPNDLWRGMIVLEALDKKKVL